MDGRIIEICQPASSRTHFVTPYVIPKFNYYTPLVVTVRDSNSITMVSVCTVEVKPIRLKTDSVGAILPGQSW